MKGLYLTVNDLSIKELVGVNNKIIDQVKALRSIGDEVNLISINSGSIMLCTDESDINIGEFNGKLMKRIILYSIVKKHIYTSNYDYIYIRYPMSDAFFIKFLRQIRKKIKNIIIEIPTYPYDDLIEKVGITSTIISYFDKYYRRKLNKYTNKIVTFSDDRKIFGIDTINIDNGINLNRIKIINREMKKSKSEIVLIALANVYKEHGFDRIINGIKEYYDFKYQQYGYDISLKIVGPGKEIDNLKELSEKLGVKNRVIFEGLKVNEDLDELFNNSDIAVGSLALHRKGIYALSPLKVREYCARGIPFIYAYYDKGIKENYKFAKKFESNEKSINIIEIIKFYEETKIYAPKDIRKIAEDNFSWEKQMQQVIYN